MAGRTFAALSDEQLGELLGLVKRSDSVELKLTLPEDDHYDTVKALGMDSLDSQLRHVFFFDTPDLALSRSGVVVRARRVQGKGDDTVVKLRPITPDELSAELRAHPRFGVEVDASPSGYVCSGSLKATAKTGAVKRTLESGLSLRKLFSKEQREVFAEHAPDGIELDDLTMLGPVLVLKLRFVPEELGRKVAAEMWFYPDFSRILELSTRCAPADAFTVAAETRAYLGQKGVDLSGEQAAKTQTTLEFFAGRLDGVTS